MTNQQNKDLFERFIDQTWNQKNTDNLDEFLGDNYIEHTPFGDFNGLDEFRGFVSMNLRAFPDFQVEIQNSFADENFVACNYVVTGTHEDEFLGIEATANKAEVDGCFLGRVENGKIVEGWNQFDALSLMNTLEVIPSDMLEETERQIQQNTRQ